MRPVCGLCAEPDGGRLVVKARIWFGVRPGGSTDSAPALRRLACELREMDDT